MKSKTSFFENAGNWTPPTTKAAFPGDFFNRTLFLKNLTRYWPLWGLASLGGGLIPLALTLSSIRYHETMTPLEFASQLYNAAIAAAPVVLLSYCILCAAAVWNYLYNPRSVGMMHSLPIRREGLFVTNCLSGLTMVAIPCVVTALFTLPLSLVLGGFSARAFLVTTAAVAGEAVFYFSAATATAFITGNSFALPSLYFIFQFLAPLLDLLCTVFASNLVFGMQRNSYTGLVEWLSPTVYMMNNLHVERLYDIPFPDDGLMRNYRDHWIGVALQNGWLIAVYALAGVVMLGIAWLLYQRRRSESAGDVIAVGWLKPVFQAGVTGVCALGGGQLLYLILLNGFDDTGMYSLFPLILCMTFAGAIGYYAAAMLLAKSLRVFTRNSSVGIAAVLGCCTVLCSLLYFDAFGTMRRVPENVSYVHFYAAGNNYYLYPGEDDALIAQIRDLHRAIVDDRGYVQSVRPWNRTAEDEGWTYENITLDYRLQNGRNVRRYYPLYLNRERMNTPGTFDNLLDELVNSTAMRQKRLHAGDARFRPASGNLYVQRTRQSYDLSSRETGQILEALGQDAAAGTWGQYEWFDQRTRSYAIHIGMEFEAASVDGFPADWDYTGINVQSGMDHTIAALKDMGYITDADLVSESEADAQWNAYAEEFEKQYGYYPDEMEYAALPPGVVSTETVVPRPVEPEAAENGSVTEDAITEDGIIIAGAEFQNPNSYTPPASSSSLDVSVRASGGTADVSGSTVDVSGGTADVSGGTADVSGGTADVSGSTVDGEDWPAVRWDPDADPSAVEDYDGAA